MLVLSRKLKEQIKIGDDITITVVKLRNNQIRLGIEAPRDVRVMRAELDKETPETTTKNEASADAETVAKPEAAPTNRVRNFLDSAPTSSAAPQPTEPNTEQPNSSSRGIRNEVVDGLMSADEMIAAGKEIDDETSDGGNQPCLGGDDSPRSSIQLFSGTIDRDGTLRENAPSEIRSSRDRAPLASFFTAP
ncbi:carbon storage regulator [Rhodopirellula sallentina]|uniref:Translational regulator CsrA n=1 Tax=Rhodopirellula sallentina SM41 TaxID=1263870 RepID=M5U2H0_9BACT|nr:carbon storage regulator [Rhodopirellula sallentina]EMI55657.1 Carbon storage regulator [Rhodopirellula sallentina SM41]